MARDFIPRQDATLAAWSASLSAKISADAAACGLTGGQAAAYAGVRAAYADAHAGATNPSTWGLSTVFAKNVARAGLIAMTRALVRQIQAMPVVTDQLRADLGLTVRKTHATPQQTPETHAGMQIEVASNRAADIRLSSGNSRRGLPEAVAGATLFTYLGDAPPENSAEWSFCQNVTRSRFKLLLQAPPAETTMWIVAQWFNGRGAARRACESVRVNLPSQYFASPIPAHARAA